MKKILPYIVIAGLLITVIAISFPFSIHNVLAAGGFNFSDTYTMTIVNTTHYPNGTQITNFTIKASNGSIVVRGIILNPIYSNNNWTNIPAPIVNALIVNNGIVVNGSNGIGMVGNFNTLLPLP